MKRWLLWLTLAASIIACSVAVTLAQEPDAGAAQQPEQPEQPNPADEARRSKVVAKIGEVTITVGQVEDGVNDQSPFLRTRYREPAKLQEFVDQMIRFELLAAEARRRGYHDDDEVARTVKQNAVQQLIRTEFDERITPESIDFVDVEQYYSTHEAEFNRPEMVRASHILVSDRARAVALIAELRNADARAFRAAAREHSIDSETKLRGGDLRYFNSEGRIVNSRDIEVTQAIATGAFTLREIGQITPEPVAVGENWSIVKLTGRRPAESRSIQEGEQGIRLKLWREQRQAAIEAFVADLRSRYNPEIHEQRMRPIRLETETDPSERLRG